MKLAISNIAWEQQHDGLILEHLARRGFSGVEIAPTRLFAQMPYSHIDRAREYAQMLKREYGLSICSMQSIWYGQSGNIFRSAEEREALKEYTYRAVEFASAIECGNIVFGNPKARSREGSDSDREVADFFCSIADYAAANSTVMSIEPNPVIYNTDFLNFTHQAFEYCRALPGGNLKVNVDLGTIIYNNESLGCVRENIDLVNHIHISEPYLAKIEKRELHRQLRELPYSNYISIEMKCQERAEDVIEVIDYVAEVIGNE